MTQVLVVCKTQMYKGLCLGGLVLDSNRKIRLLTPQGYNQPDNTPFAVGDIWECSLVPKSEMRKPHTEDMLVMRQRFLYPVLDMHEYLLARLKLRQSHKSALFDGLVRYTGRGSGYISERTGVPDYAHAFWRPAFGLNLCQDERRIYYEYEEPDWRKFWLPYVGLDEPVEWIAPGSLLHLSLARWWSPNDKEVEKRCYLQLSGWFL